MRIACSQFHFCRLVCSLGNSVASDMNCRLLAEAELQSFVIWAFHVVVNAHRHGMAASCPELHSTVTIGLRTEWHGDEKNLLLLGIESESLTHVTGQKGRWPSLHEELCSRSAGEEISLLYSKVYYRAHRGSRCKVKQLGFFMNEDWEANSGLHKVSKTLGATSEFQVPDCQHEGSYMLTIHKN